MALNVSIYVPIVEMNVIKKVNASSAKKDFMETSAKKRVQRAAWTTLAI